MAVTSLAQFNPALALAAAPSAVTVSSVAQSVQVLDEPVSSATPVYTQAQNADVLGAITGSSSAAISNQDGWLQIDAKYQALGGAAGFLGKPLQIMVANPGLTQPISNANPLQQNDVLPDFTGNANPLQQNAVLPDFTQPAAVASGYHQDYEHGSIYWSAKTGAHEIDGAVLTKWLQMGGAAGALGYPTTDTSENVLSYARVGGRDIAYDRQVSLGFNDFLAPSLPDGSGASIYVAPTGVFEIQGAIRTEWLGLGGPSGNLGYATMDETANADGVGRYLDFQGGSIYWSPGTGAHEIDGAVLNKFGSLGWEGGLGYPTTDTTVAPDGVGIYSYFLTLQGSRSAIYATPTTGAHELAGPILDKWASMGWERSPLGYPVSDLNTNFSAPGAGADSAAAFQYSNSVASAVDFQGGSIYWTQQTGAWALSAPVRDRWLNDIGGTEYGHQLHMSWGHDLGYPVSDAGFSGSTTVNFERGVLSYTPVGVALFQAVSQEGPNLRYRWQWNLAPGAYYDGYQIRWRDDAGGAWQQSKGPGSGDGSVVAAPNYFRFDPYSFMVQGYVSGTFSDDYSAWSATISYTDHDHGQIPSQDTGAKPPTPTPPTPTPPTPASTAPDIRFAPGYSSGGLVSDQAFPEPNQEFSVSWQDQNFGRTEQSFTDILRLTDEADGTLTYRRFDVENLAPGKVSEVHKDEATSFTLPAGHYRIDVWVDSDEPESINSHTYWDFTITETGNAPKVTGGAPVGLQPQGMQPAAPILLATHALDAVFASAVAPAGGPVVQVPIPASPTLAATLTAPAANTPALPTLALEADLHHRGKSILSIGASAGKDEIVVHRHGNQLVVTLRQVASGHAHAHGVFALKNLTEIQVSGQRKLDSVQSNGVVIPVVFVHAGPA